MFNALQNAACDRRGRILIDGQIVAYESEEETFIALAKKYLRQPLRRVSLLTDPPQTRFEIASSGNSQ